MRPFLVVSAILVLFVANMPAEKPFDFASTPGKLLKQVVPTEYAIRIVPNIENFTFTGSEIVKLDVRGAVRELALNVADLEIASASVDDRAVSADAVKIDKEHELLRISLSNELSPGPHKLVL